MRNKTITFMVVAAAIIFLASCSGKKVNYIARVKLASLNAEDLFNKWKAYDVMFDSQELKNDTSKSNAQQLFLKGVDQYKNKKNIPEAISLFKKAILSSPNAKFYYELGNALLDSKSGKSAYDDAAKAYEVSEYLGFKPLSMVYYKEACAEYMTKPEKNWGTINYLRQAFNAGFSDTTTLNNDDKISSLTKTDEYRSLLFEVASHGFSQDPTDLFALYINSFPVASQPFEIPLENVGSYGSQSISYDFAKFVPEMQNTSFGRETSHDFFAIAKVAETPQYVAVIYASVNYYGEEMEPVSSKLVTYDKEGNIISSKLFAAQFSADKVKRGRLDKNELILEDYTRVWKKPIDEVPFDENEVEQYDLIAKAQYLLDDSGKIVEQSVPANYSDSVIPAKNSSR
ncbi:MAG: hypothetical protein ACJ77K_03375 [Bacteroidia bacterium]|jgi:tetratricopeptide (TPR) repeat protein